MTRTVARWIRGGVALGYGAVLLASPILESVHVANAAAAESHVEAPTQRAHFAGHDDALCQVCRFSDVDAATAVAPPTFAHDPRMGPLRDAGSVLVLSARFHRSGLPRAPPSA